MREPKFPGAPHPRRVPSSSAAIPFAVSSRVVLPLRRFHVLRGDRAPRLPTLALRAVLRLAARQLRRDLSVASRVAFLADVPTWHSIPPESVSHPRIPASPHPRIP